MSRMSPGTDAKKKADRDRYHADPERFKQASRDRYESDPELFRERSQRNRLKRTDEQRDNHLGYSRSYYLKNATELKAKQATHHVANKDRIDGRRRFLRLEAKLERDVNEILLPALVVARYFELVNAERIELARIDEERTRLANKRAGVTITQENVDDAISKFLKDGGTIEKIKSETKAPTVGLVGVKSSHG